LSGAKETSSPGSTTRPGDEDMSMLHALPPTPERRIPDPSLTLDQERGRLGAVEPGTDRGKLVVTSDNLFHPLKGAPLGAT
jgi:hypothetical protein